MATVEVLLRHTRNTATINSELRAWRWEQSVICRKVAADMKSAEHRRLLIEVAESWERLAEQRFD